MSVKRTIIRNVLSTNRMQFLGKAAVTGLPAAVAGVIVGTTHERKTRAFARGPARLLPRAATVDTE